MGCNPTEESPGSGGPDPRARWPQEQPASGMREFVQRAPATLATQSIDGQGTCSRTAGPPVEQGGANPRGPDPARRAARSTPFPAWPSPSVRCASAISLQVRGLQHSHPGVAALG